MKYKVGDKVRVRDDLVVDRVYGGLDCLQAHKKESGKIFTITYSDGYDYHLNGMGGYWWSEEMLENAESITILVKGNKVIAKRGDKVGIAKCSPEDEFDIFTGTRLAIDRLEEKCNPYNWLKKGVRYFVPSFVEKDFCISYIYRDDCVDKRIKERGVPVFKTEEEAINYTKKMLGK